MSESSISSSALVPGDEIVEPSYQKPFIRTMVAESNGHTIFQDFGSSQRSTDPYAPSRDLVYSMKYLLVQLLDDLLTENYSPSSNEAIGSSGFSNHRLLEGFNSLVDTINSFVGHSRSHIGQTLDEAARENGYAQLPSSLKQVIEATLGRLYLSAFFFAARSLTPVGGTPLGDIGYQGTFDFVSHEVQQALDGIETDYARTLKHHEITDNRPS